MTLERWHKLFGRLDASVRAFTWNESTALLDRAELTWTQGPITFYAYFWRWLDDAMTVHDGCVAVHGQEPRWMGRTLPCIQGSPSRVSPRRRWKEGDAVHSSGGLWGVTPRGAYCGWGGLPHTLENCARNGWRVLRNKTPPVLANTAPMLGLCLERARTFARTGQVTGDTQDVDSPKYLISLG